jgi:hypothetical protein
LLDFRGVSYVSFSWPLVVLGAAIVVVVGVLVDWGVSALERRTREGIQGERLQLAVGHAIARDAELVRSSILPVAGLDANGRPCLELTGAVPSEEARRRAVGIAQRELAGLRPGMAVVDRLDVVPSVADRRRA